MTRWRTIWLIAIPLSLIAIAAVIASHVPYKQASAADAAAVVLTVTAASIAIERGIEFFWTTMGLWKGSVWPLNVLGKKASWLSDSLDDSLKPVYEHGQGVVDELERLGKFDGDPG